MPHFNRPDMLLRAVASVRTASPDLVEVVVVDDASREDPAAYLPEVTEDGVAVRLFRMSRNRGPQAARNLGIRRARYAYVAFLDSDDTFDARKVDVLLRELADRPVDVLFHAVVGMERYERLAQLWTRFQWLIPFRTLLALYNPATPSSLVVRRRARLGCPWLRHCEDYLFLLRYCEAGTRVTWIPERLSRVHRPAGSAGGLSGNRWRMRVGEFTARRALLRERSVSGVVRYAVGTMAGCARVTADLVRGRYGKQAR